MSETANCRPTLAKSDQNLVWLDCEMTGWTPKERLIEIAVVVTGPNLTPRVEGRCLPFTSPTSAGRHGRLEQGHARPQRPDRQGQASTMTEAEAEQQLIAFLARYVPKGKAPLCGNSIGQDRRFLVRTCPSWRRSFTTATST
jgi:oligoribonuclease